jgi:hypothetical protein
VFFPYEEIWQLNLHQKVDLEDGLVNYWKIFLKPNIVLNQGPNA